MPLSDRRDLCISFTFLFVSLYVSGLERKIYTWFVLKIFVLQGFSSGNPLKSKKRMSSYVAWRTLRIFTVVLNFNILAAKEELYKGKDRHDTLEFQNVAYVETYMKLSVYIFNWESLFACLIFKWNWFNVEQPNTVCILKKEFLIEGLEQYIRISEKPCCCKT